MVSRRENNAFKNRVKSIISRVKFSYYRNKFQSSMGNLSNTWQLIKSLISNCKSNSCIKKIIWNNVEYDDNNEIANAFNQYFCSVAQDLDSKLPHSDVDPLSYLPPPNPSSIFMNPISYEECSTIIMSLKKVE